MMDTGEKTRRQSEVLLVSSEVSGSLHMLTGLANLINCIFVWELTLQKYTNYDTFCINKEECDRDLVWLSL